MNEEAFGHREVKNREGNKGGNEIENNKVNNTIKGKYIPDAAELTKENKAALGRLL